MQKKQRRKSQPEIKVTVEIPKTAKLSPEQREDLKKRLESAMVLFFPDLHQRGRIISHTIIDLR
jgi:hypothetical protein